MYGKFMVNATLASSVEQLQDLHAKPLVCGSFLWSRKDLILVQSGIETDTYTYPDHGFIARVFNSTYLHSRNLLKTIFKTSTPKTQ